jgi:transmembrane sensor
VATVDDKTQLLIARQAAEWFVRNRGVVISAEDRARFAAWLRSSPLHIEEYLKTAVISRDLHAAIDTMDVDIEALLADVHSDAAANVVPMRGHDGAMGEEMSSDRATRPLPSNASPRASGWRRGFAWRLGPIQVAATLATVIAVLAGVVWTERDGQRFGLPKHFVTAHGEQRSWLLPDGTSLNLNSDSAVTVRYDDHERLVQIDRGQALFQVVHESRRRFRVQSGDIGVIAVGTAFEVFRKPHSTVVTVAEGRVAVFTHDSPRPTSLATLPAAPVSVSAGEQVQIVDHTPPAKPATVNVQQAMAWVQREIAFDQRPLGEVAADFNRYSAVPIVIQSDRLRDLAVSGVFSAYDTDSFIAFISRLDGAQIERSRDRIIVRGYAGEARSAPPAH